MSIINSINSIYLPFVEKSTDCLYTKPRVVLSFGCDNCAFENTNVDKKVFVNRKIIGVDDNINTFFDNVSSDIFQNKNDREEFAKLLKEGRISLSSSCYKNLKNPKSAIALKLNPNNSTAKNISILSEYVSSGSGVGINFSNFENPVETIRQINGFFKYKEKNTQRPPAGIALLNINHPEIENFITMKDNASYDDWCFDLSVVIDDDFLNKVDNNSDIVLSNGKNKKAKDIYEKLLSSMLKKGEPAVIFSNDKEYICDSCAASQLKEKEELVLGQINLSKFYDKSTNSIDYKGLKRASKILFSAMKKISPNPKIGILGYQDLLDKMSVQYGTKNGNEILSNCIKTIKSSGTKMAISPTGTISRFLKTSPSIEPKDNSNLDYYSEIDTLNVAQNLIDGQISKTIILKPSYTTKDVDNIIRYSKRQNLKGISVFPILS